MVVNAAMEDYSALRKGNPAICDDVDEPGGHHANWS